MRILDIIDLVNRSQPRLHIGDVRFRDRVRFRVYTRMGRKIKGTGTILSTIKQGYFELAYVNFGGRIHTCYLRDLVKA